MLPSIGYRRKKLAANQVLLVWDLWQWSSVANTCEDFDTPSSKWWEFLVCVPRTFMEPISPYWPAVAFPTLSWRRRAKTSHTTSSARVLPGMSGELRMSTPMITRLTFWQNYSLLVRSARVLLRGYCTISSESDARDHKWMCGLGISSEPPVFFWTFNVLFCAVGGYDINHWIDWEDVTTTSEPSWMNEQVVHASFIFDQAMHELLVRSVWIMALLCRYAILNAHYDTVRWVSPNDDAVRWVSLIQAIRAPDVLTFYNSVTIVLH